MKKILLLSMTSLAMLMADFTLVGEELTPVSETTVTEPTTPPVSETAPATSFSVETIWNDMHLAHEGKPHGVPSSWEFAQGPVLKDTSYIGDFTALTGWGQVYEELNGSPAVNTRVELRNLREYYLSRSDGQWHLLRYELHPSSGTGYKENYTDQTIGAMNPAIKRTESSGNISCKPGDGWTYHFYADRVSINPSDIAGVVVMFDAKLIVENPLLPDDRDSARFIASGGLDVWRTMDAVFKSDYSNNHDIGIGRFRYITKEWQTITTSTSFTLEQLQQNPPPLN